MGLLQVRQGALEELDGAGYFAAAVGEEAGEVVAVGALRHLL